MDNKGNEDELGYKLKMKTGMKKKMRTMTTVLIGM